MAASYRWVILAVCTLGFMQTHIHRVGFAPLIPTFVADLKLTYAAAGAIMTAYFWTYAVAQVPIGLLADRWGARRVMLAFMSLLVAGVVLFPLSQSYLQSFVSRALVGLGAAAVWVPSLRLIGGWFPGEERGRVIGILSAGGGVGGTVGLLFIPLAAEWWGWRWGYASTLSLVLLTLGLLALFVRDEAGPSSRGASATGASPPEPATRRGPSGPSTRGTSAAAGGAFPARNGGHGEWDRKHLLLYRDLGHPGAPGTGRRSQPEFPGRLPGGGIGAGARVPRRLLHDGSWPRASFRLMSGRFLGRTEP